METPASLPLRLIRLADLWVQRNAAQKASLPALGRRVMNDSAFFTRLAEKPVTRTSTLERFASFLALEINWPDGIVPDEVRAFVHAVGLSPLTPEASPEKNMHDFGGAPPRADFDSHDGRGHASPPSAGGPAPDAPLPQGGCRAACTLCTRQGDEIGACAAIGCPFDAAAETVPPLARLSA